MFSCGSAGFAGAFQAFGLPASRAPGTRKHRENSRKLEKTLLRSRQSAREGCSSLLRSRQCARKGCSSLLRRRQCARKGCSSLLRSRQCARKGCTSLLRRRQCVQKGCSSLLRRRQCVQKGCSSLLFKITIPKCWSRLHCALSHCTLLCFAPCMDMHGSTLVYIYICVPEASSNLQLQPI